jgi:hypothetical protein
VPGSVEEVCEPRRRDVDAAGQNEHARIECEVAAEVLRDVAQSLP